MGEWVLDIVLWIALALAVFAGLICAVAGGAITWKEKEIKNPVAKFLIVVLVAICGSLIAVLSPLWIPAHFVLKAYGRKGFFTIEGGTYGLAFNRGVFSRVEEL